ncbi:helix-turn-helix transcriptional regulator [Cohnella laeviribosi]|uniref:helix-turn-helix transcriptional regulator n=1 Tax=Cohnella laeviribosi TaxID=380174 RepID=UPI000367F264|nr:AraC family transcriptional regulator [Cohnella laeviribosi]
MYYTLKSLVLELDRREAEENLAMLLFAQLLIRIARLRAEAENKSPFGANPHVRKTVDFLYQNYDRPIQVKDIAAAANVHPGYLHRIFKAQTGQTLTEYLTALRMEKAKMLLLHTDVPVADISDYVGVGSRPYFHSLFKKHTNMTPLGFRRSMVAEKVPDG